MKGGKDMKNKKKSFAIARLVIALLLAAVLLYVSGFAFVPLLGGAQDVTDASELSDGEYVAVDVTFIMDFVAMEISDTSGEAVSYYAVAPVGNKFVVFCFRASSYEDALALYNATDAYMQGTGSLNIHLPVKGMAREMSSSVYTQFYSWFDENHETMTEAGIIGSVTSYADYLCPVMVVVDAVGDVNLVWAYALTGGALALLLYAIVELILILSNVYKAPHTVPQKPIKKSKRPHTE